MATPDEIKRFKKGLINAYGNKTFGIFWAEAGAKAAGATDANILDYLKTQEVSKNIGGFERISKNDDLQTIPSEWLYVGDASIDDYRETLEKIDEEKSLFFCMNCGPVCDPQNNSKNPTEYKFNKENEKVCKNYCGKKNYTCDNYLTDKLTFNLKDTIKALSAGIGSFITIPGIAELCTMTSEKVITLIERKAEAYKKRVGENVLLEEVRVFINYVKQNKEAISVLENERATVPSLLNDNIVEELTLLGGEEKTIQQKYNDLRSKILVSGEILFDKDGRLIDNPLKLNDKYKKALEAYYYITIWGINRWGNETTDDAKEESVCPLKNRDLYEDEEGGRKGGGKKKSRKKKSKKKKTKKKKSRKNKKK